MRWLAILYLFASALAQAEIRCDNSNRCLTDNEPNVRHVRARQVTYNEREVLVQTRDGKEYRYQERTDREEPRERHYFSNERRRSWER